MGGPSTTRVRVAVIGAGPGGLCTAKRLLDEGVEDFVLLERTDDVGGTWNLNRYPGCECDVQSAMYSFSFAIKPDWSKPYGTQPEILAYMRDVAERFGILPHVRLGNAVTRAVWDGTDATWTLTLDDGGTVVADVVVSAIGMFNELAWPDIEGLDTFAGTMFHSGRWDWDHDLTEERVAVIGSAASAVQFVPEIREQAAMVHLFQRTANWVTPKVDTPYTEEQLEAFRRDPTPILEFRRQIEDSMNKGMTFADPEKLALSVAAGTANLEKVLDPVVREKLRPRHPFGCKRPLMSNVYYPAFNEPNLELVTEPIARVTPTAVVTEDGRAREVDTIVLATGFAATTYLAAIDVVGRDGRSIHDAWADGAVAHLGITTAGFPNLFMLYGPNTNNGSIIYMLEAQVEYVVRHLRWMDDAGLAWIDVRPEVEAEYNDALQADMARVGPWSAGNCHNYYWAGGRIVTQWPHSMSEYRRRTEVDDRDAFVTAS